MPHHGRARPCVKLKAALAEYHDGRRPGRPAHFTPFWAVRPARIHFARALHAPQSEPWRLARRRTCARMLDGGGARSCRQAGSQSQAPARMGSPAWPGPGGALHGARAPSAPPRGEPLGVRLASAAVPRLQRTRVHAVRGARRSAPLVS
jgi:hypothetical protein